jgi:hypothetical protein
MFACSRFDQCSNATCPLTSVWENGPPILFDEVAGKGATGTVLRSRAEKKILKYGSSNHIRHEALIYGKLARLGCNDLAIPRYWGLYPFRAELEELAIILDDAGIPIGVDAMTREQRCDFLHIRRTLL